MSARPFVPCCANHPSPDPGVMCGAGSRQLDEYVTVMSASSTPVQVNLQAPTVAQLAALTAVPAALVQPGGRRGRGKKGKGKGFKGSVFNPIAGRPMPALTSPLQAITVTLVTDASLFATSTTVPTFGAAYLALTSFPKYAEYAGLFDQYRFDEIEAWIEPPFGASETVASGIYHSAVDLDDANAPTSVGSVSGKQGAVSSETIAGHYHRWSPHMAVAAYSGAFTSYSNQPAGWIDVASPAVQHFGLKAEAGTDGVARTFAVTYRAKISFRGPGI